MIVTVYVPAGVFFVPCWPFEVVRLNDDEALPEPGASDAGEKEQLAPVGNPLQESPTAFENVPPKALTLAV